MQYKTRALILFREENSILGKVKDLRKLQEEFDIIKEYLRTQSESLGKKVKDYKKLREKQQRMIWKERGLNWCQKCGKIFKLTEIQLLYTHGLEENNKYFRRIRNFCKDCASDVLNQVRCGKDLFECCEARNKGKLFIIFKNDRWQKVEYLEDVIIEIEKKDISENDFELGKSFEFLDYPKFVFKANGEDIFAKKEGK